MNGRIARRNEVAKYFAWLAGVLAVWSLLLLLVLGTGCASMRSAADTALTVGRTARPEYASAIEQIQKLLRGGPINPVEGFEFETIWRYEGHIIDAAELSREDRFWRVQSANEAGLVTVIRDVDELTAADQALKDQIERILQASGVIDEE